MRTWVNVVEAAREALGGEMNIECKACRWCERHRKAIPIRRADGAPEVAGWYVCGRDGSVIPTISRRDPSCDWFEKGEGRVVVHSCETCAKYLGNGHCDAGLENECRDGGFEAWTGKR